MNEIERKIVQEFGDKYSLSSNEVKLLIYLSEIKNDPNSTYKGFADRFEIDAPVGYKIECKYATAIEGTHNKKEFRPIPTDEGKEIVRDIYERIAYLKQEELEKNITGVAGKLNRTANILGAIGLTLLTTQIIISLYANHLTSEANKSTCKEEQLYQLLENRILLLEGNTKTNHCHCCCSKYIHKGCR